MCCKSGRHGENGNYTICVVNQVGMGRTGTIRNVL